MEISKEKQERGFFWAYIAIGVIAVVGGIISINSQINGIKPFLFNLDSSQGPVETESQKRLQEIAEKRLQDSDNDGLNDYDEEYVYKTSSLLADTDSDGKTDSDEIAANTDPNCTEGQVCFGTSTNTNSTSGNTNASVDLAGLDTSDPAVLRSQLEQLGVPKNVLDQVSDEDLVTVYASVSSEYGSNTNANVNTANINGATNSDPYSNLLPNTNGTSSLKTYDDFANLDANGIRQLLIQSGMSADDLADVSDDALKQLYENALQQANEQAKTNQ